MFCFKICCIASMDFPNFLAIHLYHPLLPKYLQNYNLCPYRDVVDRF